MPGAWPNGFVAGNGDAVDEDVLAGFPVHAPITSVRYAQLGSQPRWSLVVGTTKGIELCGVKAVDVGGFRAQAARAAAARRSRGGRAGAGSGAGAGVAPLDADGCEGPLLRESQMGIPSRAPILAADGFGRVLVGGDASGVVHICLLKFRGGQADVAALHGRRTVGKVDRVLFDITGKHCLVSGGCFPSVWRLSHDSIPSVCTLLVANERPVTVLEYGVRSPGSLPDDPPLVAGGDDRGNVFVWDPSDPIDTGRGRSNLCVPVAKAPGDDDAVLALRWASNNSAVYASYESGRVAKWILGDLERNPRFLHSEASVRKIQKVLGIDLDFQKQTK